MRTGMLKNNCLTNEKKTGYHGGTKNLTGGYPFPFNTVNHLQFQSARKGLNTPVSAFGNGAGSIPVGLLVTPELFCLLNRKASENKHRRQAMPNLSNTAVSQPQSIVQQFQSIQLIVTPDKTHDFLMSTENVAKGYGVSDKTIQNHKIRNATELLENTHFISDLQIVGLKNGMTKKRTLWTKRGVIRLGMFIKSQRAIKFRDWAENLIVNSSQPKPTIAPKVPAAYSSYWESTGKVGVFRYKRGVSNAMLLPTSRFRFPDEFATEEGIANILKEDIARLQFLLDTKSWLNAFDGYGIKILPDGQKVYSTVVFGEYAALTNRKIRGE